MSAKKKVVKKKAIKTIQKKIVVPPRAIGAEVTYYYKGEETATMSYISFGEYNEDTERDTFGYPDEDILYYATKKEFPDLCSEQHSGADFYITEYDFNCL
jgi:hypothetical protein